MNDQFQELFTRKNIVSLLVLAILVLAIPLGVRLIEERAILTGQATSADLSFTGPNVVSASPIPVALSASVGIILTPPWPADGTGEPNLSSTPGSVQEAQINWGDACNGAFNANVAVNGVTHDSDDPNVIDVNWDYTNNQPRKSKSGNNLPNEFKYVGAKVTLSDGSKSTFGLTEPIGTDFSKDINKPKVRFRGLPLGPKTATLTIPEGYKMITKNGIQLSPTYSPNTEKCGTGGKIGDKDAVTWTIEPV